MKHIIAIGLLLALGCGAIDDDSIEPTDDNGELGTAQQELSVNSSKYGISTASSHVTCRSDGPSGQDCLVPTSKTIQYCYSDGGGTWSAQDITNNEFALPLIAGDFTTFSFTRVLLSQTSCRNSGLINKIQRGVCSGGSGSGNIEAFVCYSPSVVSGPDLVESLPGRWRKMQGGTITVDTADLTAIGDDTFGDVRKGGITHSLAAAAGFGCDTTVVNSALHTSRNVGPLKSDASNQEKCFANSVNPGGGGGGGFMAFNGTVCN